MDESFLCFQYEEKKNGNIAQVEWMDFPPKISEASSKTKQKIVVFSALECS